MLALRRKYLSRHFPARQRLETESAPISRMLVCSDEAKETAAERLQTRKFFPTNFVPQPSWNSDEEALVSFLLLYSSSDSWTFRSTDVSLGTNPSLVQYQKDLASLVCWYCELAALLTAHYYHRFCWLSSLFHSYQPSRFLLEYPAKTPLIPLSRIGTSNSHILDRALRPTCAIQSHNYAIAVSCNTRPLETLHMRIVTHRAPCELSTGHS